MFSSLRSKILAGFAAIIMLNVTYGLWVIYQFSDVGDRAVSIMLANYELNSTASQLVSITDRRLDLLQSMNNWRERSASIDEFDRLSAEFVSTLKRLGDGELISGRESIIASIRTSNQEFQQVAVEYRWILAGLREGDARKVLTEQVRPSAIALKQNSFNLIVRPVDLSKVNLDEQIGRALILVVSGTIIAMLLGLIGGGFYARWIVRPIQRLTSAARSLGGGQLSDKIIITSNDELGDLTFEFNRMVDRLRIYEEMNIEQLLLEKRKAETIVQSIATPIIVVDATMRLMLINTAAREMFRLPLRTKLEGEWLAETIPDVAIVGPLTRALDQTAIEPTVGPDIYVRQQEGREQFFSVAALPLATTLAIRGAVAVFSDITHFKELDKLKSEFLAKVSHEFRTPLSSISLSLDILREGIVGGLNESQRELVTASKDDCRRLSKLISDLLELSRIESRVGTRSVASLDLAELVASVLKPLYRLSLDKGVEIVARVAPDIPTIWGDAEEFRWVLNNLLGNALRHTGSGGRIEVTAALDADAVIMDVSDSGEGIPLESLGRIFEKFHQIGLSSISTPGSVGLGLAIAKQVVESYGGRISVVSEVGRGSTFTVRIPLENISPPLPPELDTDTDNEQP